MGTDTHLSHTTIIGYRIYNSEDCSFVDYKRTDIEALLINKAIFVQNLTYVNKTLRYGYSSISLYPTVNFESKTSKNVTLIDVYNYQGSIVLNKDTDLNLLHNCFFDVIDRNGMKTTYDFSSFTSEVHLGRVCNVPKYLILKVR